MHIPTRVVWAITALVFIGCSTKNADLDTIVTIHTKHGYIKVILFEDTPLHKESFISMAKEGIYDSTVFHRVINGFMIQGGDVGRKPGFENDGKRLIPAEIRSNHLHVKGALAAAREGDNVNPEKKSSIQFYIVQGKKLSEKELTTDLSKLNYAAGMYLQSEANLPLRDSLTVLQEQGRIEEMQSILVELKEEIAAYSGMNLDKSATQQQIKLYTSKGGVPHLDGAYTVFGQVVEGIEVVDKIAQVKTGVADMPVEDIIIIMTVEEVSKKDIVDKYEFNYPTPSATHNEN